MARNGQTQVTPKVISSSRSRTTPMMMMKAQVMLEIIRVTIVMISTMQRTGL